MYEFSTETLFFGRQDSMQRTSLVPLHEYIRDLGLDPSQLKLLEVNCGTGRFHTFIKVSRLWGIGGEGRLGRDGVIMREDCKRGRVGAGEAALRKG